MLTTKKWRGAFAVGVALVRRGFAGWLGALLAVLVLAGCSPPGRRNLLQGERLIREGRPAEAIRPLQQAVTLLATNAPACAQAWNFLGLAYHYAHQPAAAAQAYQNALAKDFNLVVVRFNRGCLFLEQNNLPAALNELTTYTTHQPKDALGWTKLGTAQMRSRQVESAEGSFRRALDLNPPSPLAAETLNNLGLCNILRRRFDDASKYFNAALRQQTNHPPALLNQAIIAHQQSNDLPVALDRYRAYLRTPASRFHAATVSNLASQIETELRFRAAATSALPTLVLVTNVPAQPTNALLTAKSPTAPPSAMTNAPAAPSQPTSTPPATNIARVIPAPPAPGTPSAAVVPEPLTPTNQVQPPPVAMTEVPKTAPATALVTPSAAVVPEPRAPLTPTNQVQPPPVARVETPPPKPVPVLPSPSAAPSAPVEVVRLEPEPEVKAAQEISVAVRTAPPPAASSSDLAPAVPSTATAPLPTATATPAARPVVDSRSKPPPPPKKKSLLQRLNPLGWIGGKDKTEEPPRMETATTPLPAPREVARESSGTPGPATPAPVPTRVQTPAPVPTPAPAPAPPPAPVFARYNYLRPGVPAPGNRARAEDAIAQGIQAHKNGQYPQALAAYKESVQADPSFFEAQYNLGVAAFDAGDWSEALVAFEQALALRPEDSSARLNFALSLDRAGYPVDAAHELESLLAGAPGSIDAHAALANLYADKLANNDKARVHYTKVLQLNPGHPQAAAIRRWLTVHRPRP